MLQAQLPVGERRPAIEGAEKVALGETAGGGKLPLPRFSLKTFLIDLIAPQLLTQNLLTIELRSALTELPARQGAPTTQRSEQLAFSEAAGGGKLPLPRFSLKTFLVNLIKSLLAGEA
jgi:hypothetical protein